MGGGGGGAWGKKGGGGQKRAGQGVVRVGGGRDEYFLFRGV